MNRVQRQRHMSIRRHQLTHVEHSVGFVHDEVGNTLQVGLAALQHVDQTTGSSNDNLGTSLEVTDLLTLGDTSVDGGVPDPGRLSKLGALGLDLDGQLSSRREDQDDGSVTGSEQGLSVDVNHGGQGERDGLSGTSLGDSDEITSRQGHGPSLTLNGRGSGETGSLDLSQDVVGESGLVEAGDGSRDVLSLDEHLLFGSESLDLTVGSSRDTSVLNVEADEGRGLIISMQDEMISRGAKHSLLLELG